MEKYRVDFEEIKMQVLSLSNTAQATLMHKLIYSLPAGVVRSVVKYCYRRLDDLNAALPDDAPEKQPYLGRQAKRMESAYHINHE